MENMTIFYAAPPPQPAMLLILERGKSVRAVPLRGNTGIGREDPNSKCGITLSSGIVSRDHGEFVFAQGNCYYFDHNSLNGTFYNGVKLPPYNERGTQAVLLNEGDVLRIDCPTLQNPHPDAVEILYSRQLSPDEPWNRFPLSGMQEVTIGRDAACRICLSDFMASRRHAVLSFDGSHWVIRDANSRNGMAVNREPLTGPRVLMPFDVIRIANTVLIFTGDEIVYNHCKTSQEEAVQTRTVTHSYENRHVVMNVCIDRVRVPGKTLLKDIRLDVDSGDFILILGGSGAGKTTFIKALLGEHRADGRILLGGMDLYKNFTMLKHKIGLVPQFATTRDADTVYHTIYDAAEIKLGGDYKTKEIKQRVDEVIEKMNLVPHKKTLISKLSGGQRKRVEVAIQAIGDQDFFILDEPDSGMDPASRIDLMSNLKICTENGGVVAVISHSPDDAASLFTKVIVLAKSQSDEIGHLAYYGDVQHALQFFGVKRLSDIIMEINFEGSGKGRGDEFIRKFEMSRGNG